MQGHIELIPEGSVYHSGQSINQYQAAAQALHEAFDRRRGYLDEMEKLIGVRSLEQYPTGVSGAVVALLGVTNQLETKSRIGWDSFVIGELLQLINSVGTTAELIAIIAAKRADNMERLAFVPTGLKPLMEMSPELKAALRTSYPRPIEEVKEFAARTVKEEWEKLKKSQGSLAGSSRDLEEALEAKVEEQLKTMPTINEYSFVVNSLHTWKGCTSEMRVSVDIKRDDGAAEVLALVL